MNLQKPFIVTGNCETWPCRFWTINSLVEVLGEKKLSCRLARRDRVQLWETESVHLEVSLKDFNEWLEGKVDDANPLVDYNKSRFSCYIDYKYMKDVFSDAQELLNYVKWSTFGLHEFNGYDSTLWIGSEEANTQCHQDSYGFNLITQIYGRKLWVLFPPEDGRYLYPTRVPYEESSVFSSVNVRNPDMSAHPLFMHSHPMVLILSPGQTLYVPQHWWHYVLSLEPSISINVWIPASGDVKSRYTEAITRTLASSLIRDFCGSCGQDEGTSRANHKLLEDRWLNPTETIADTSINFSFLRTSLNHFLEEKSKKHEGCESQKHSFTESQTISLQRGQDPHNTESERSREGTRSYLERLALAVKDLPVVQVPSPFELTSTSTLSSEYRRPSTVVKRQRFNNDYDSNSSEHSMSSIDNNSDKRPPSDSGNKALYTVSPYPVRDMVKRVKNLCDDSMGPKSTEISESSSSRIFDKCQTSYDSSDHQMKDAEISTLSSPEPTQSYKNLNPSSPSCNESESTAAAQSSFSSHCSANPSSQHIAEALLKSVLHPDVVEMISVKLEEELLQMNYKHQEN